MLRLLTTALLLAFLSSGMAESVLAQQQGAAPVLADKPSKKPTRPSVRAPQKIPALARLENNGPALKVASTDKPPSSKASPRPAASPGAAAAVVPVAPSVTPSRADAPAFTWQAPLAAAALMLAIALKRQGGRA